MPSQQQHISEPLLRQINESKSSNLAMQSQCRSLSRGLQIETTVPQNPLTQIQELQQQLQSAHEVNATSRSRFDELYKDQQRQIFNHLQDLCMQGTAEKASVDAELATLKVEHQRLMKDYAALQKQFEAEKNDRCRVQDFPATALKLGQRYGIHDEDDEEVALKVKQEPGSSLPKTPSSNCNAALSSFVQHRLNGDDLRRKASLAMSSQVRSRKHRRSREEEVAAELRDLEVYNFTSTGTKMKRSCTLSTSTTARLSPQETRARAIRGIQKKFRFSAVTGYDERQGHEMSYDSKEDLQEWVGELWDAILVTHEAWEESRGEAWKYEFVTKLRDRHASSCVSAKLKVEGWESGRSIWRPGCAGKYACKRCAEELRPCFIWDGETFKLLPLHAEDRTYKLKDGYEVRYWLNVE